MASATQTTRQFDLVIHRLHAAFPAEEIGMVQRMVHIAVSCAEHLGYTATDELVERLVAERLRGRQATSRTLPSSLDRPGRPLDTKIT